MATTDHFIAIPYRRLVLGEADSSAIVVGTSSSAASFLELRWQEDTVADAAHPTGITRKDILIFLEVIEKFIHEGGILGDGVGVPIK
jgi:hypothetical protein